MNISLPQQMAALVREEVSGGKYASVSEFFRTLLREWQEDVILKSLKRSQKDMRLGKGVYLKSLRDLR